MRAAAGLVVALVCSTILATEPVQRTLTFDERVRAQTAIERVYYAHQLGATKRFEEAVPQAVIEAKVHTYLEQTAALSSYWKTAVTDQTLQRELERMAHGTRMPERLQELFAALGNDPFLVKECLARPALVDRLTHNFYAFDATFHAKERGQADALHGLLVSGALSPTADNSNRTVTEIVVGAADAGPSPTEQPLQQRLTPQEFAKRRAEYPTRVGQVSDVNETRDAFAFSIVLSDTTTSLRVASYAVPKTTWDAWWAEARRTVRGDSVLAVASRFVDLPAPNQSHPMNPTTVCPDDYWDNGILDDIPDGQSHHTAVWTGSWMVVWGGNTNVFIDVNSGGRYDPATDTWMSMSRSGAPTARVSHTAIWTGSRMLVWGGIFGYQSYLNTGGQYDPVTDTWTSMSTTGAPSGRFGHTAVWTASRMLVWGGYSGHPLNSGGQYDPSTDRWTPISTTGAPIAREGHTAVWTGTSMVVWGGQGINYYVTLGTGGRYDPATDSWTETSVTNAPSPRRDHGAVWTGTSMLVWGGNGFGGIDAQGKPYFTDVNTGGRYDPLSDTWSAISNLGAPLARYGFSLVWTGRFMVVWGGNTFYPVYSNTGGRYDPQTDTWTPTSTTGAPAAREYHSAVWTGSLMVVWGGEASRFVSLNTGGRYDPASDGWTPTTVTNGPPGRAGHTAVWTGSLMVVWGGFDGGTTVPHVLATGARYDPATDVWTLTSNTDAPSARDRHTAVWTGNLMVVWGGAGANNFLGTGGRYDPATDLWTPVSTVDAPTPREDHTSIWTGSLMVVWGGYGPPDGYQNTGGRYDPATNTWTPTSMTGVASPRTSHAAVWTGTMMVVWGGGFYSGSEVLLNTGGLYDPATDAWTAMSITGAPSPRTVVSGVWTGSQFVTWGGYCTSGYYCDTGGRYDPVADTWKPTSSIGTPSPRYGHAAVWTGSAMLVWGGKFYSRFNYNYNERYDPVADTWTPTATANEPSARTGQSAVWTGSVMILWGGLDSTTGAFLKNGGRYSPGAFVDGDCDGDGFTTATGDCNEFSAAVYPGAPQICDGLNNDCNDPAWPAPPAGDVDNDGDGFLVCQGDCDDNNATVYPGAPQLCDGINNDCNDPAWPTPSADEIDADQDGACVSDGDCDDTNPRIGPGFWEYCDGVDNDCNGVVDDGPVLLNCDDGNPCTDEVCDGAAGCSHILNTRPCNDQNACTADDVCGNGACHGTPQDGIACSDGDPCTTADTCARGACIGGPPLQCSDGDACNGLEFCYPQYGCAPGSPPFCYDYNECTDDSCDPAVGCVYTNNTSPCDDNNVCTAGDVCREGACSGAPLSGTPCNDLNTCTTNDTCTNGYCTGGTPVVCDDGNVCNGLEQCVPSYGCYSGNALNCDDRNPCTDDSCDHVMGCVHTNNTGACSDGNFCTSGDYCDLGTCHPGAPVVCDDDNPCTQDSCSTLHGCRFTPTANSCVDGDPCTVHDYCQYGFCYPGEPRVCDDGNVCTSDTCESGVGCVFTAIEGDCDDNNVCTTGDTCSGGACVGTPTAEGAACDDSNRCTSGDKCAAGVCAGIPTNGACDDSNPCTSGDTCATGVCVGVPTSGVCEDGNPCTTYDYCDAGVCHRGTGVLDCDDDNLCTVDSCNPQTGCVHDSSVAGDLCDDGNPCTDNACDPVLFCVFPPSPAGGACDDFDPCTHAERCDGLGNCIGQSVCDDHIPCTNDFADPGAACACFHEPLDPGTTCSDNNACTTGEVCDGTSAANSCNGGSPVDCNDDNPCTNDSCNTGTGCVHASNTNACNDGNVCTVGDRCGGGECNSGTPIDCNDNNDCTDDVCDPSVGCVHINNADACDDGNACTVDDACGGGACRGGPAVVCNDFNPCTTDTCNPASGCVSVPNTNSCDDGNACTTGDTCDGGTCHPGTATICNDNNPCTDDSCDPASGCVFTNNANACDDGNACTSGDACGSGSCHGTAIACDDHNTCTTDTCNTATGCVFTNNSNSCNDGNACTKTDICTNGACVGSNPVTCGAADQCHAAGTCDPASGVCSNPVVADGTICNDHDLCTTGETCRTGTCTPASSGLNEANPRTTGYYKRLCQGPHSGDQLINADAVCVASVAHTFAGISTVADLCAELEPTQPNSDPCDRSDDDLMVLALNICRARVCVAQSIDSQCGTNGNVGQSLAESDTILGTASRNADTCAHAKCLDEEINTGRALELNSLTIRRDTNGARLEWRPPYLNDGTGRPSKYDLWRRVQGSLVPFTKLGTTTDEFFVDAVAGSGAFQYEVTAVMN